MMNWYRKVMHSIKARLILSVFIIHAILMGLVVYDLIERQQVFMHDHAQKKGKELAALVASNAGIPLLNNDLIALDELIEVVKKLPDIYMVLVIDDDGRVRASSPSEYFNLTLDDPVSLELFETMQSGSQPYAQKRHDRLIDTIHPVMVEDRNVGYVRIMTDTRLLSQELLVLTEKGLLYILFAIVAGVFLAWLAVRRMTRQISLISRAASQVSQKNFDIALPPFNGHDEVEEMGRAFTVMLESIHQQIRELEKSKETLTLAFEGSSDGMWDWNIVTDEIYYSPRFKEILGFDEKEVDSTVDLWQDRVHPDDLPPALKAIQQNIDGETEQYRHVHRIRHLDGHWLWVEDRGKVQRDEAGRPVRMIGTLTDITEKRSLQYQLESQYTLLRSVLDSTPDLIFYKDYATRDGVYLGCNEAFAQFVGKNVEEITGCDDFDLFSVDIAGFFRQKDRAVMKLMTPERNDEWVTYPDGRKVLLQTYKAPLYDQNHKMRGILGISHDITKNHDNRVELQNSKNALENAQAIAHIGSWEWDIEAGTLSWSDEIYRIFGESPQSFPASYERFLKYIPRDEREKVNRAVERHLSERAPYEVMHTIVRKDGLIRYVREEGQAQYNESGEAVKMIGIVQDITDEKVREEEEKQRYIQSKRYQKALFEWSKLGYDNAKLAMSRAVEIAARTLEVDRVGIWLFPEEDFSRLICQDLYELEDHLHRQGMEITRTSIASLLDDLSGGKVYVTEDVTGEAEMAELYAIHLSSISVKGLMIVPILQEGKVIGIISFSQPHAFDWSLDAQEFAVAIAGTVALSIEVEKRRRVESELNFKAYHDDLTHLPNRMLYIDRLQQAILKAQRSKLNVSVLFIDLDHFKEINDSLGHAMGDRVLIEVAERLKENLREVDTIARLGGDEFILIVDELRDIEILSEIATKLIGILEEPIHLDEHELYITSSIGISVYPGDGDDPESLMRNADAAMYRAKAEGRNSYQFYTMDMTERAFERLAMVSSMRRGLENEEFVLHFQPQFDGESEKPVGMEVLIRWEHPSMGLVSPAKFIPLAEESGMIIAIDRYVIKHAMIQLSKWHSEGKHPGTVYLNLSVKQLQQKDFLTFLDTVLQETGCQAEWIGVEVTEGQIMKDPEEAITTLNQISEKGISIAVDDFGTGYSSLSYLKRLPIDKLKIDQSFVRELPDDEEDCAIVRAVIALGHSLNMLVIAEGVETEEQKNFLIANNCRLIQGYYYGHPMNAEAMTELLENHYQ